MSDDITPEWALNSNGDPMVLRTQLCTRGGRRIGNAIVTSVPYESLGVEVVDIRTDFGNELTLNREELGELFHTPTYVHKSPYRVSIRLYPRTL